MNYIGTLNGITKPEVKANGVNVVSAKISSRVGEIPTCSLSVLPEDVNRFDGIDTPVSVVINGSTTIFKGYPTGINFSNMHGGVSAGVDLVHAARDLSETSTMVPGIVPASTADAKTVLYHPNQQTQNAKQPISFRFPVESKPFGPAVCEGIEWFIANNHLASSIVNFVGSKAGDRQMAIEMLKKIASNSEKTSGKIKNINASIAASVARHCFGILTRMGNSSTIWDTLSAILGAFDSVLLCLPDGEVTIVPNYNGVKATSNSINSSIIQKFDRSCVSQRSPSECAVVARGRMQQTDGVYKAGMYGHASSEMAGSRGSMLVSCPQWLEDVGGTDEAKENRAKLLDAYAKSILMRYEHEQKTFSVMCPVCPGAFPGTCATFRPTSSIKSFSGKNADVFSKEFDGYCYSVEHVLSSESFYTSFMFKTALESDKYPKQQSHPLFEGDTMPEWT